MLLIELNSISKMGSQKIKVGRKKKFIPKKNMRHVSIQDFKKQKQKKI